MVNELKLIRENEGKTFTSGAEVWKVVVTPKYITYRKVEDGSSI